MAIVDSTNPTSHLRGKLGGMVFAKQPNGTVTVRSAGSRAAPATEGERKGQHRMKLAHAYVHGVLQDPAVRAAYDLEARCRKMRTCDLVMSDFMTDPVILSIDTDQYHGLAGGSLLVITGDDFKVTKVGIVVRNSASQRLEEGFARPAHEGLARVWIYTALRTLAPTQAITIEVTATDRASHSTVRTAPHSI